MADNGASTIPEPGLWARLKEIVFESRKAPRDVAEPEFNQSFLGIGSSLGLVMAFFFYLATMQRVVEMIFLPEWPLQTAHVVIIALAIGWMTLVLALFVWQRQNLRYTDDFQLLLLLGIAASLAVFNQYFHDSDNPLGAAQFIAFCFSLVAVHYRHVLAIFVLVTAVNYYYPPPGTLPFDQKAWVEFFFGTALLFILVRPKTYILRQMVTARLKERNHAQKLSFMVEQLRESEEQQRSLAREVIRIQEKERANLSRELHDELGQTLTAIKLSLDGIQRRATPELVDWIRQTSQLLSDAINQVRGLATELRPSLLDQLGLQAAIQWSVDRYRGKSPIEWTFVATNGHARFSTQVEAACFRIAQEAMTNAVRHAQPRHVRVACHTAADSLTVSVEDDGVGFGPREGQPTRSGLGILGMHERAASLDGELKIESHAGRGTLVQVTFRRAKGPAGDCTS
jgi:signal transduction histidine kinase